MLLGGYRHVLTFPRCRAMGACIPPAAHPPPSPSHSSQPVASLAQWCDAHPRLPPSGGGRGLTLRKSKNYAHLQFVPTCSIRMSAISFLWQSSWSKKEILNPRGVLLVAKMTKSVEITKSTVCPPIPHISASSAAVHPTIKPHLTPTALRRLCVNTKNVRPQPPPHQLATVFTSESCDVLADILLIAKLV